MIEIDPYPDEVANGFLGRWRQIHSTRNWTEVRHQLSVQSQLPKNAPLVLFAASAAAMAPTAFIRAHSLIPFQRIAVLKGDYSPHLYHGDPSELSLLSQLGMLTSSPASLCHQCIADDEASASGTSYWRRSHQIPGIDWCPIHGSPLATSYKKETYGKPPARRLEGVCEAKVEQLDRWPVLQRYIEIAAGALHLERPACQIDLSRAIGARAKQYGLRLSEVGKRPLLSDIALRQLPKGWIRRHVPQLATKAVGTYCNVLDNACRTRAGGRSTTYILALAIICSTSEEALKLLQEVQKISEPGKVQSPSAKIYDSSFWKSDQLRNLYVQLDGSHPEIARQLGCSTIHVRNSLNSQRLPSLNKVRDFKAVAAVLDFQDGESLTEAVSRHDANMSEVEFWLRQDWQTLAPVLKSKLSAHHLG